LNQGDHSLYTDRHIDELAFLYPVERKSWFFVMTPMSIMIVIEKSNGIGSEQRCKIIIENSPAIIWLTYFSLSLSLSLPLFIQAWLIAKIILVLGTMILSEQVN